MLPTIAKIGTGLVIGAAATFSFVQWNGQDTLDAISIESQEYAEKAQTVVNEFYDTKTQLETIKQSIEAADLSNEDINETITELETQIDKLNKQYMELFENTVEINLDKAALQEELDAAAATISQLQDQLSSVTADTVEGNKQLGAAISNVAALQTEYETLNTQFIELYTVIYGIQLQINDINKQTELQAEEVQKANDAVKEFAENMNEVFDTTKLDQVLGN